MRVVKIYADSNMTYPVDLDVFEKITDRKKPWYQGAGSPRNKSQFAVCPSCDNPVQLVGLYINTPEARQPYARHTGKRIDGFPFFDPVRYKTCDHILAKQPRFSKEDKQPDSPVARKILKIVKENFDRVIYIIRRDTGVNISRALAEKMLESYLGERGHLYRGATLTNIPWIVAYMSDSQSLFGQYIASNTELRQAIIKHAPKIALSKDDQIRGAEGHFAELDVCFIHHRFSKKDGDIIQTMKMRITKGHQQQICEQKITFDLKKFERLLCVPPKQAKRDQALLDLADQVFTKHRIDV